MCDCDAPQTMTMTTRKARVDHVCVECGSTIAAGSQYEYVSGVWDHRGASFKTCLECVGIRNWYVGECLPHYECHPCFGQLIEDATDSGNAGTRVELVSAASAAGYL